MFSDGPARVKRPALRPASECRPGAPAPACRPRRGNLCPAADRAPRPKNASAWCMKRLINDRLASNGAPARHANEAALLIELHSMRVARCHPVVRAVGRLHPRGGQTSVARADSVSVSSCDPTRLDRAGRTGLPRPRASPLGAPACQASGLMPGAISPAAYGRRKRNVPLPCRYEINRGSCTWMSTRSTTARSVLG